MSCGFKHNPGGWRLFKESLHAFRCGTHAIFADHLARRAHHAVATPVISEIDPDGGAQLSLCFVGWKVDYALEMLLHNRFLLIRWFPLSGSYLLTAEEPAASFLSTLVNGPPGLRKRFLGYDSDRRGQSERRLRLG